MQKRLNASSMRNNAKGPIDEEKIRDWIIEYTSTILEYKDLQ